MNAPDPRPVYAAATEWVTSLLQAVAPDQLDNPTPCTEFDVLALSGHLLGTAGRAAALGAGTDIFAVSVTDRLHEPAEYAATTRRARELWSDDAKLDAPVTVPWGTVPGSGALWGYVNETLVHGWDLAVATGQDAEAPAGLAEATLPIAQMFIGADIREIGDVPFGEVVTSRSDAGPTEVLANWSGRTSAEWVRVAT